MAGSNFRSQIEVLSVVDKGRRRDWTDAEKVRIVEESLRGYRQCAATAQHFAISRALLTRRGRESRSGHLAVEGPPQFIALQVAAEANAPMAKQPTAVPSAGGDDRVDGTIPLRSNILLMAERGRGCLAKLTRRRLKHGVFHSVFDLQAAINRFVKENKQEPKPFIWRADPDQIIAAVKRGHQALESIHLDLLRKTGEVFLS